MKNCIVSKNLSLCSVTTLLKELKLKDLVFTIFENALYKRIKMLLQAAGNTFLEQLSQALSPERGMMKFFWSRRMWNAMKYGI